METVKAYLKPNHSNYKALFGENKKRYLNFIIKINKNGKEILSSCDPKSASLASCYFEKKVLDNYKKNDNRYRIKNNVIYDNYKGWNIKSLSQNYFFIQDNAA